VTRGSISRHESEVSTDYIEQSKTKETSTPTLSPSIRNKKGDQPYSDINGVSSVGRASSF
jgi:hypothetical protein